MQTDQTNHFRRLAWIWFIATAILTPIVIFVLGPGLPPGNGTVQAAGQVTDNIVLMALSVPVAMAVLVTLAYEIWAFRERDLDGPVLEGPAITGNSSIQMWWLIITTSLVLFLAGFGSVRLLEDGSGGGQGPSPLVNPAGSKKALQVQVIAQQWEFTYRYPGYGGIETPNLVIPANTMVEFHVTSLDVVHSFWAYQLGVKADANPGIDNIAYVKTKAPMSFEVHCAELCGVWHGYMFDAGRVVSKADFATWIAKAQKTYGPAAKSLPPYSKTYFPSPVGRGG
ncbi:MAG TPA: cytochrome c oxidase subunit II [Solirubrobacteraceae bacterium]|jgi:cytochrome c oxidase subunit 2|nr:cytochrome c oxidase subunit II [Solirubrobacteraceae bacterium]